MNIIPIIFDEETAVLNHIGKLMALKPGACLYVMHKNGTKEKAVFRGLSEDGHVLAYCIGENRITKGQLSPACIYFCEE